MQFKLPKFLVCDKGVLGLFGLTLVGVAISHLLTLSFSPMVWIDETHLLESGRCAWGRTGYPESWDMDVAIPSGSYWYWVGTWCLNQCYEWVPYLWGHRLFTLAGLFVAALALFGFAIKATGCTWFSVLIALHLLVDRNFSQNTRGSRVDAWVVAFCFLALLIAQRLKDRRDDRLDMIISGSVGALLMLSTFFWVSAMLLWPLVLAVFWMHLTKNDVNWTRIAICLGGGAVGALAVGGGLVFPLLCHHFGYLPPSAPFSLSLFETFRSILTFAASNPFIIVLGLLGLVCTPRNKWLALGFVICMTVSVVEVFTVSRLPYVLSYCYIAAVFLFKHRHDYRRESLATGIMRFCAIGLLCGFLYGLGYSVVLRTALELPLKESRSYAMLKATMLKEIGGQGVKIYADTFQTYLVGRELGWEQYRITDINFKKQAPLEEVLPKVNYILCETQGKSAPDDYSKYGFVCSKRIEIPGKINEHVKQFLIKHNRPLGLGPYWLYVRNEFPGAGR